MISITTKGSFKNTFRFFDRMRKRDIYESLEVYAMEGVLALAANTPIDTALTSESWGYQIVRTDDSYSIIWTNDNFNNYVSIALILQYGHWTGTGGWVQGIDYINPALRPIFDKIADKVWKAVTSA